LRLIVDAHAHTISSGHSYSTIQEMAQAACSKGIEMLAVTDHGPALNGAPALIYFTNLKAIPEKINGVKILKGVEANIIDYTGRTDMPDEILKKLDYAIASLHEYCITPSTTKEHTQALVNALKNPYIDVVGHPGNPHYQVDIEAVVKAAKENGKLIEINNHSFSVRTGSERNCKEFVLKCKEMGVKLVCGSDAHISFDVGRFGKVLKLFEECGVTEDLVINTSVEKFYEYLKEKKERLGRRIAEYCR